LQFADQQAAIGFVGDPGEEQLETRGIAQQFDQALEIVLVFRQQILGSEVPLVVELEWIDRGQGGHNPLLPGPGRLAFVCLAGAEVSVRHAC
jgi:hypothetical protein